MKNLEEMEKQTLYSIERLNDDVKRLVARRDVLLENQNKYPLLTEDGRINFHDVEWGHNGVNNLDETYNELRMAAEKLSQYHETLQWIAKLKEEAE